MTGELPIEKRSDSVAPEVAQPALRLAGRPHPGWLKRLQGSMKDMPGFALMDELGREARRSDQPTGEPDHPDSTSN